MRTESAFRVDAESWANAIGLLQLLVPTARGLVRPGEKKPDRRSLKTPEENIRLGTRFLGQLAARFQHILFRPLATTQGQAPSIAGSESEDTSHSMNLSRKFRFVKRAGT